MTRLPDFIVIGAMKSATTTLFSQLARQSGIFMSSLKEPNFFSDDDQYARGIEWYASLFAAAPPSSLAGEASTHYTKRPDYPLVIARMRQHLQRPRFIYVMRHPIDRLISQYIHQWSERQITSDLPQALRQHPELINYSRYHYQLEPYFEAFGQDSVLPVFHEDMVENGQRELQRVFEFLGHAGHPMWAQEMARQNVSSERIRRFPGYDLIMNSPLGTKLRRTLVPKNLRTMLKGRLVMPDRPELSEALKNELEGIFDEDLRKLSAWSGRSISCRKFHLVETSL